MPTYDYTCDACGQSLEIFQSMSDKPVRKCPECGRAKLRRLIGAGAGIIFKGSGFHGTDYRSAAYQSEANKDAKPAACAGDSAACSGCPNAPGKN